MPLALGRETADHRIFLAIRTRILTGSLPAGMALSPAKLAEELVVSTAPIRDALIRLTERGLVTHLPARGFVVRVSSLEESLELLEVLAAIVGLPAHEPWVDGGDTAFPAGERTPDIASASMEVDKVAVLAVGYLCSRGTADLALITWERAAILRQAIVANSDMRRRFYRLVKILLRAKRRRANTRVRRLVESAAAATKAALLARLEYGAPIVA